jgi:hypothetical protein
MYVNAAELKQTFEGMIANFSKAEAGKTGTAPAEVAKTPEEQKQDQMTAMYGRTGPKMANPETYWAGEDNTSYSQNGIGSFADEMLPMAEGSNERVYRINKEYSERTTDGPSYRALREKGFSESAIRLVDDLVESSVMGLTGEEGKGFLTGKGYTFEDVKEARLMLALGLIPGERLVGPALSKIAPFLAKAFSKLEGLFSKAGSEGVQTLAKKEILDNFSKGTIDRSKLIMDYVYSGNNEKALYVIENMSKTEAGKLELSQINRFFSAFIPAAVDNRIATQMRSIQQMTAQFISK